MADEGVPVSRTEAPSGTEAPADASGASEAVTAASASGTSSGDSGFGLGTAMALIIGSIIGVGIFNLPTSLASYGPITLVSMGLTTIGALALAMLFAALSRRLPADGGPYAYARVAYGNMWGFANAWSYWITAWAGNAAIAVGWVLYVEQFVNTGHKKVFSILLVLVGLWVPAMINLSGVKKMGLIQVVTTILKFFAVGFVAIVGLFYINTRQLPPLERQRRERDQRHRRRHGNRPVQLPRRGVRLGGRGQGAQSESQRSQGDHPRHAGDGGCVHALSICGLRDPLCHGLDELDGAVLGCRQCNVWRHGWRGSDVAAGHHLRVRCTHRLDDDLR